MLPPLLTIDFKMTSRALESVARQIPYAAKIALNDLAFQVQRAENQAMTTVFVHPRPFTARSVQVNKADVSGLTAEVFVRPEVAKYLLPYEIGGTHVLPGKALLNPKGITLDQYGQLPYLTMTRLKGRQDIFVGGIDTQRGGRISGVWQRLTMTRTGKMKVGKNRKKSVAGARLHHPVLGALRLLIRFGNALPVNKDLEFNTRGVALVMANAATAFGDAIRRAMMSAR